METIWGEILNLIILGPQGSGKGTQAKKISAKYKIPHISTGDIFRENIKLKTELGKKVEDIINKGLLVSDELTFEIVKNRLKESDCKSGYILDGYPRNLKQAEMLESYKKTDKAIAIEISNEEAVSRISGRRSCPYGHVYHIILNPPKEKGVCNIDKENLFLREDDKPEVVEERLNTYNTKTKPLLKFYDKQKKLVEIDGKQLIDKVFSDILYSLKI